MPLEAGTQLGPYEILSPIGAGGMGEVYKARDTRLDRTVAIKVLPAHVAADPELKRRFEREAKTISSLNHPHICTLYDIGHQSGIDFLVMEYLEGETLEERLQHGALQLGDAVQHALVILSTLEAVHRRGLMHRDLKPANLFLTTHGLKLLDFGLARPIESALTGTTLKITQAGAVLGTPQYVAPESLYGQPVDARADLFAVGTLLYEMLAGQPPFKADSLAQLVHAVAHERPPALTGSATIAAVDRVIYRAMAKRPDDRYPSADAMSQDLRDVLARSTDSGETPTARPVTRLIVLPLRVLRPDSETDFLAFSLPDAIASSLSGLGLARGSFQRRGGEVLGRGTRPQGDRRAGGRGHRARRHAPASRSGPSRELAASGGPRGDGPLVPADPGIVGRPVPAAR